LLLGLLALAGVRGHDRAGLRGRADACLAEARASCFTSFATSFASFVHFDAFEKDHSRRRRR
jgi:hypothetical protein